LAFSDPLVIPIDVDAVAAEDNPTRSFSVVGMVNGSSIRRCINAVPGLPNTLKISHQTVGKGANQRHRHLVRFETAKVTEIPDPSGGNGQAITVEGQEALCSCYLVIDVPVGYDVTNYVTYQLQHLVGFIRGNNGDETVEHWNVSNSTPPPEWCIPGFLQGMV